MCTYCFYICFAIFGSNFCNFYYLFFLFMYSYDQQIAGYNLRTIYDTTHIYKILINHFAFWLHLNAIIIYF